MPALTVDNTRTAGEQGYTIALTCRPCERSVTLTPADLVAITPSVRYIDNPRRFPCKICRTPMLMTIIPHNQSMGGHPGRDVWGE